MDALPVQRTRPRRERLVALDAVRVLTVLSVIVVHSLSILVPEDADAAGPVLTVFHSSREVFLLLSALVLTFTAGDRDPGPVGFWRRRMPLVVAPYAVWTVLYLLSDGDLGPLPTFLGHLGTDLLTGRARYHLYFVLLTVQLYLVFPWLLRWIGGRRGRLLRICVGSLAVQLAFTAIVHYHVEVPAPLSWLVAHPGSWLPAYQLYVLAGIAVGLHVEEVARWCAARVRALGVLALAVIAGSVIWYVVAVRVGHSPPVDASEVFQPAVVFESLALGAFELGACQRGVARAGPRALRLLAEGSDVSFGVYLLHPLLLQVAVAAGAVGVLGALPSTTAVALVALGGPPVLLAVAGCVVALLRRTPLSLWLCGRPRRVRQVAVETLVDAPGRVGAGVA